MVQTTFSVKIRVSQTTEKSFITKRMSRGNICPCKKTAGNKMANIAVGNLQRQCRYEAFTQISNYTTTNYTACNSY